MHRVESCRLDTFSCSFQVINPCIQARVQTLSGMEGSGMGKPFFLFLLIPIFQDLPRCLAQSKRSTDKCLLNEFSSHFGRLKTCIHCLTPLPLSGHVFVPSLESELCNGWIECGSWTSYMMTQGVKKPRKQQQGFS